MEEGEERGAVGIGVGEALLLVQVPAARDGARAIAAFRDRGVPHSDKTNYVVKFGSISVSNIHQLFMFYCTVQSC
jgi:hypothetical protein